MLTGAGMIQLHKGGATLLTCQPYGRTLCLGVAPHVWHTPPWPHLVFDPAPCLPCPGHQTCSRLRAC
jgi:hypothetical protein